MFFLFVLRPGPGVGVGPGFVLGRGPGLGLGLILSHGPGPAYSSKEGSTALGRHTVKRASELFAR